MKLCKYCETKMILIGQEDGKDVHWCPECGTIAEFLFFDYNWVRPARSK